MIDRVELRAVTCPPNTPQNTPARTDCSFDPGTVIGLEIVIADGHAGFTGLAIGNAQQIVIPASGQVWITSNDEVIKWPLEDTFRNGNWQAFTFNTDLVNLHTWYLRFLVIENFNTEPAAVQVPFAAGALTDRIGSIVTAPAGG